MSRWLPGLLLAVALSGCTHSLSESEQHTVSELTTHLTTRGLGRYLIDLPPTWRFGSGDVTLYYGLGTDFKTVEVTVIDQGVTPAQFEAAVNWRAARLKAVTNNETHSPMLVGLWPVDVRVDDGQGGKGRQAFLLRYYDDTTLDVGFDHELHLLLGSTYVRLAAKSYEGLDSATETTAQVDARLKTLSREIFLTNDPARSGPGFILGNLIIRGPQDHEQATFKFYDPQRRDITLEIHSSAVTPDEQRDLLQRSREAIGLFPSAHTLRLGERAFAGMRGEEALHAGDSKAEDGKSVHELAFAAETYRPDPGLMRPTLSVKLIADGSQWISEEERTAYHAASDYLMDEYGLPSFAAHNSFERQPDPPSVSSSLTDHEAMAVWDAILPTIRPRPGAVAPVRPKDEPPSRITREQAERDRQTLDDFIASRPGDGSRY
ncbi:T6SS immunity protein Tli4 family protein [Dyella sp. 20L07]|uniref:T6SS immunity protein Tli4 family protein n=1 Tax=Dyella sp. 20L07 TaxID=3384240 RepID=UPI003D2A20C0